MTPTYPTTSLTGRTFPNPGWHLPTNIRITPQIFPSHITGTGRHASRNCHTWTAFRYIAGVFWGRGGRWIVAKICQLCQPETKLDRQPDLRADCNHSLHYATLKLAFLWNITFLNSIWHFCIMYHFRTEICGTYINWATLSFYSNSPLTWCQMNFLICKKIQKIQITSQLVRCWHKFRRK